LACRVWLVELVQVAHPSLSIILQKDVFLVVRHVGSALFKDQKMELFQVHALCVNRDILSLKVRARDFRTQEFLSAQVTGNPQKA
jgi:hypothetical protein